MFPRSRFPIRRWNDNGGREPRACNADPEARTLLADQQRDMAAMLPQLPNERLVYNCENQRGR